jgi:hypothetical protein
MNLESFFEIDKKMAKQGHCPLSSLSPSWKSVVVALVGWSIIHPQKIILARGPSTEIEVKRKG